MLNLISHSKPLINPYLVLVWLFLEIQILLIMTQPPITMVQLFDLSADQRQRTTVGNSFTNKNHSGWILPFSNAVKYKLPPCTKTLSMVAEFQKRKGTVCADKKADKLIKEHCFPRDWQLKRSWPWWILPCLFSSIGVLSKPLTWSKHAHLKLLVFSYPDPPVSLLPGYRYCAIC